MKKLILILALFFVVSPLYAVPVLVDNVNFTDSPGGSGSLGVTHSVTVSSLGTNGILVMSVSAGAADSVITVPKWNGVTMTSKQKRNATANVGVELFYLVNPSVGTFDVTYTVTSSNRYYVTGVRTYSGVDQVTPMGTSAANNATSSPLTVNISSASDELVIDVAVAGFVAATTIAVGAGQTQDYLTTCCSVTFQSGASSEAGAASVTMSWTFTGSARYWAIIGVALKPATSTGVIALVDSNSYTDGTGGSGALNVTRSFTVSSLGANGILIVSVTGAVDAAITLMKWNGVSMTSILRRAAASNNSTEMFQLLAPAVGTFNITYTITSSNKFAITGARTYSGVDQTTPLGTAVRTSGTTNPITVNVTSAVGELVIDHASLGYVAGNSMTAGAGQTQDYQQVCCAVTFRGAGSSEAGAATTTMSWTIGGTASYWSIVAVPLKPAAVTPPSVTTPYVDGKTGAAPCVGTYSIANRDCTGADGNSYATITLGLAAIASGDTLTIRGSGVGFTGVYAESIVDLIPTGGGTWATATIVEGYSGDTSRSATIKPASGNGFDFNLSSSYIILRNLTVDGASLAVSDTVGILVRGSTTYIRIDDCLVQNWTASNVGFLLPTTGGYNELIDSEIYNSGRNHDHFSVDDGISIENGGNVITGNIVHGNAADGVGVFNASGQYANNNLIMDNSFYDNGSEQFAPNAAPSSRSGIFIGSGTNNRAINNLVYGNPTGIRIYSTSINALVYNNVVYNNNESAGVGGLRIETNSSGTIARNNIVQINGAVNFQQAGLIMTLSNNLCSAAATSCTVEQAATTFVTPGSNFHLKAGSAAAGAGFDLSSVFTTDYEGTTRTVPWDIGAYKFTGNIRYVDGKTGAAPCSGNYSVTNRTCTGTDGYSYVTIALGLAATGSGEVLDIRGAVSGFTGIYDEIINNTIPAGASTVYRTRLIGHAGETAEIKPTASVSRVINIQGKPYIEISNLTITGGSNVDGNLVSIENSGSTHSSYYLFENNILTNPNGSGGQGHHCLQATDTNGDVVGWTIINNTISQCIDPSYSPGNLAIYTNGSDGLIEGNIVTVSGGGSNSGIRNGESSNLYKSSRTIIRNNKVSGAYIGINAANTGDDRQVYNNIVYSTSDGTGIRVNGSRTLIYNNTIWDIPSWGIYLTAGSNHVVRNNIVYQCVAGNVSTGQNDSTGATYSNNLITNPSFTDSGAGDFTLQVGSTAIGAGLNLSSTFTTDYNGVTRTVPWDIGAFKFGTAPAAPTGLHRVTP